MASNKVLIVRTKPNGDKEFRLVSQLHVNKWISNAQHWHIATAAEKKEWEKKNK